MIPEPERTSVVPTIFGPRPGYGLACWVFIAVTTIALITIGDRDSLDQRGSVLVGTALLAAAAAALLPAGSPIDSRWAWTAAGLAALAPAAAVWDAAASTSGYAPWYARVATIVIAVLLLRGRPLAGWIGAATGYAILIGWGLANDAPPAAWSGVVARQAATLVVIEVLAIFLARAQRGVIAFQSEERLRVSTTERRAQVVRRRELETTRMRVLVTPLLERIASGEDSEALRREADLLGAELRDLFRGALLAGEPVTAAARAARTRGIDVVLLDDLGPIGVDADGRADALAWIADRLAAARGPRVTVRLSADGDRAAVTFYAEGSSERPEVFAVRSGARRIPPG